MSGIDPILAGYEILRAGQEAIYEDLHQHPEPSHHEHRTARCVARGTAEIRRGAVAADGHHARSVRRLRGHREALGPVRLPQGPGLEIDPGPDVIHAHPRTHYLAGRLSALDARLEDAHMSCSMHTKASASDSDQGIGQ
jgi:hypothetical protein